jgi:ankyrin repeat protein
VVVLALLPAGLAAGAGDTRLADAVEHGQADTARALLTQRVDVNAAQPDGATALHWAAHRNEPEMADLLIRAGADVNVSNDLGVAPVWLACSAGADGVVERLLAAGARPGAALPNGETALMACARTGRVVGVKALLARGAATDAKERDRGQTALMLAAAEMHADVVKVLIEGGADVQARSKGGFTPLMFAAQQGDLESARHLIASGANLNEITPDGNSPLLVAAGSIAATSATDYRLVHRPSGHEAVAILLLEKGANPDHAGSFGMTALHAAVETGKPALLRALLARGANPNARLTSGLPFRRGDYVSRADYAGATPFWLAARIGAVDMMRVLADAGADSKQANNNQTSPLMVAAGVGQTDSRMVSEHRLLEAVRLALELGGDLNAVNRGGQSAVHGAASISADSIIRFLAEHGARVDLKDRQGRTPLDVAQNPMRPRPVTADLLRKLAAESGGVQ